ncbi:MAG: ABC transporter substrate-binding protein [Chelatococcus sp.]|uniref:ABC transporter substrate-binding protein n=1 Tax=Chelatococcus sp. TaxID=1953771 RepID=UPI0025BBE5D1|nr:ABC transporter substrate-binding protein [Chelatococcus sp.]MBX3538952.1 ABC transporter substrate-binding protein [Chelatococcus sp.]
MTGLRLARLAWGAALALGLTTGGLSAAEEIKIGTVLPMTGDAASYGTWMRNGMNIAVDQINAKWGPERKLTVIYEDSKSNPRDGVAAMNKLIAADRVGAVMTTLTGITKALIPIAEEKKVILTTSATLPGITEGKSHVFRNATNLGSEIRALNEFAKTRYKKAAILWVNLEWADWGAKAFEKQFKADGGEVVGSLSFAPDATDVRAQLTRIRVAKPDVILVLAYKTTGQVLKQARELGIEAPFIGTLDFELPEVVQIAKEAAEGSVYTKAVFDTDNPVAGTMTDYTAEYQKRYGQKPEVYGATMYDMLLILAEAMAKSNGDTEATRKAILSVKDFPGASGTTTFLPNGDVDKAVELKTIKGGQYVDYKN